MSRKRNTSDRRIDIKTLARECGYSVGTVSMALNGSPMVKKSTSEAILAKASELGYVPNIIAQLIATKNSGAVGIVVPNSLPPLFPSIVYGMHHAFESVGRRAFVVYSMDEPSSELYYLKVFGQLRVSGIIAAVCPGSRALEEMESLHAAGARVVLIDRTLPGFESDFCGFDHRGRARRVTEALLAEGRERIAVAGAMLPYSVIDERKAGFWEAMEATGRKHSSYLEIDLDYDHAPVRLEEHDRNVAKLVDYLAGVRPDGIVLALDGLRPSVEEAVARLGIRIPQDLSVRCFDDLHGGKQSKLGPARSYGPGVELGHRSGELLLRRMEEEAPSDAVETILLDPSSGKEVTDTREGAGEKSPQKLEKVGSTHK